VKPAIGSASSVLVLVLVSIIVLVLAACSGAPTRPRDPLLEIGVPAAVTIQTRTIAGLGPVLVDSQGHTLYLFGPDARSRVSCVGACAGTWPPLVIARNGRLRAGAGVDAADLATLADPNTGADIATYGGYPLYRYAGDVDAGTANGQGLFLDGGPWYTLDPAATPVTTKPAGGA
jgi:predicted lipoprotein with Yx(FWY)xxD motif